MKIIKCIMQSHLCHLIVFVGIGSSISLSSFAHHSWSEFDSQSKVMVEGIVSKLEWKSPHARLYVDVVDENGVNLNWNFELPSPNTLMRRGWNRKSLLPGDKVRVAGIRARNFPTIGIVNSILDENGEAMFTGATPIN
jgi:hypothetical protein